MMGKVKTPGSVVIRRRRNIRDRYIELGRGNKEEGTENAGVTILLLQ